MTRSISARARQPVVPLDKRETEPANSRHRIFDAAEALFAAHGYAATTVQGIADLAQINKRMLYHYFGSKRGLYDAVVQHNFTAILGRVVAAGRSALETAGPAVAVAVVAREYFNALESHPRYVRFMEWEEAEGWLVLNELPHHALDAVRQLLIDALRQGMDEGLFDRHLDPGAAWTYVIGVPGFHFNYRPRLQVYSDEDLSDPAMVVQFRNEIVRFALLGIGTDRATADQVVDAVAPGCTNGAIWRDEADVPSFKPPVRDSSCGRTARRALVKTSDSRMAAGD